MSSYDKAPISVLPDEILQKILRMSACHQYIGPVLRMLSGVCKRWQAVIFDPKGDLLGVFWYNTLVESVKGHNKLLGICLQVTCSIVSSYLGATTNLTLLLVGRGCNVSCALVPYIGRWVLYLVATQTMLASKVRCEAE